MQLPCCFTLYKNIILTKVAPFSKTCYNILSQYSKLSSHAYHVVIIDKNYKGGKACCGTTLMPNLVKICPLVQKLKGTCAYTAWWSCNPLLLLKKESKLGMLKIQRADQANFTTYYRGQFWTFWYPAFAVLTFQCILKCFNISLFTWYIIESWTDSCGEVHSSFYADTSGVWTIQIVAHPNVLEYLLHNHHFRMNSHDSDHPCLSNFIWTKCKKQQ